MFGNYILVVVAIMIAFGLPARADSGCYPATGIEVFKRTRLRERYWVQSNNDRAPRMGERFAVRGSTMFDGICWVKVADAWIRSDSVIPGLPPDPREATPVPETIAVATRVPKSTMPEVEMPRIDGGGWFATSIGHAMDYLKNRLPDWYIYVATNTRSIGRSPERDRSTANGRTKHTAIAPAHLDPIIVLASVLVHEACHMVQYDRGVRKSWSDYKGEMQREKECLRVQRDMMRDYDRNHWFTDELTEMLSWSDGEWLMNMG